MAKGMVFSHEASDPIAAISPALTGIWFNIAGEMIIRKNGFPILNVTQALDAVSSEADTILLRNDSGSTLVAGALVSLDNTGGLKAADPTFEQDAETFQGIVVANILNNTAGSVIVAGKLTNITTSIPFGASVYVSKTGTLTDIKPDIGVAGFIVGDWVIKVGVIVKNVTNPLLKDLVILPDNRGQL